MPFNPFYTGLNDQSKTGVRPTRAAMRFLWSHPHIYQWWTKFRYKRELFDRSLRLVVDGFPRSGNSYTTKMIIASQGEGFHFLKHPHCPAFLIAAAEVDVPGVLTLRQPVDSVISWVIFMRDLSLEDVLKLYIDFYRVLLPIRTQLLVLNFTTITKDFGTVFKLMNQRFALNLNEPENLEECDKKAMALIDQHYVDRKEGYDPLQVARPHPKRELMKGPLRDELMTKRYADLLAECEELYASFDLEARRSLEVLAATEVRAS